MNTKTIIGAIIVIILTVTVMVPIFDGLHGPNTVVQSNTNARYVAEESDVASLMMTTDGTDLFVDGTRIGAAVTGALIVCDNLIVHIKGAEPNKTFAVIDLVNNTSYQNETTVTINADVLTVGAASLNMEGDVYHVNPTGDLGVYAYTDLGSLRIPNDARIVMVGTSGHTSPGAFVAVGTRDGFNIVNETGATVTDYATDIGELSYGLSYTPSTPYNSVIAPVQYQEYDDLDPVTENIVMLIPLLTIIGLVIGIIVTLRKD